MRARGPVAVAAASLALCAVLVSPASASSGVTGNAAAIRLYRAATVAMNDLKAYVVHQYGYMRISDSIGTHPKLAWSWGNAQFQPGEVPTTERLTLVQRGGAVAWIEDLVRPQRTCAQGGKCPTVLPIEFFITPKAAFVGIVSSGSQTSVPCFRERAALQNVPYEAGGSWWYPIGHFSAPLKDGALTELAVSYANDGQTQIERDWMADATHLFVRSTFSDAPGGGHRAFAFGGTYSTLSKVPTEPQPNLCS